MSKVAFVGGSINAGDGFDLPHEKNLMWINLVHNNCFPHHDMVTAAESGISNSSIFKETVKIIAQDPKVSIIFCSWVSLLRYTFSLGHELYYSLVTFTANGVFRPDWNFNLNTGTIPRKYVADINDRFLALHHYHYEICKLLEYTNIINDLCHQRGIAVYHINDSCPWDDNYFHRLENVAPQQYTNFTKTEILNINNRDDEEIFKLYKKMHDEYDQSGGINPARWVNLYSSWLDNIVDTNHDNHHPGAQSNHNYYTTIKNFLESQATQ